MKCYVTFDLLKELIYGKEDLAAEIENHIIGFLKKEIPVCTSSLSLGRIIEAEKNQVHSGIILSQSEILFSEIFSFSTRDIRLGINIEKDYQLGRFALFELAVCLNSGVDLILDINDSFNVQKMISVRNLCAERM